MGGACISKPRSKKKGNAYKQQQKLPQIQPKGSSSELQAIVTQTIIGYPYYQPMWKYKKKEGMKLQLPARIILSNVSSEANISRIQNNFLPRRFYSYLNGEAKSAFNLTTKNDIKRPSSLKKVESIKGRMAIKSSLFQSLILATSECPRLQVCPQTQYLIVPAELVQQCSQETTSTTIFTPKAVSLYGNQSGQLEVKSLNGQQEIKTQLKILGTHKRVELAKNCLVNGMLFINPPTSQLPKQNINGSNNTHIFNLQLNMILQILHSPEQASSNKDDQIILYLNPAINQYPMFESKPSNLQYSTYLQFKAYLQQPKLNIVKLFNPSLILTAPKCQLTCVYILIFALKMYMHMNVQTNQIPIKFLEELIKIKQNKNTILSKIINIIKVCYIIGICYDENISKQKFVRTIEDCCRNILQISIVNSHILIDAYLIQFSIQIQQRIISIRQNPLIQFPDHLKYRQLITKKPNLKLINLLKNLFHSHKIEIIESLTNKNNDTIQIIKKWENRTLEVIKSNLLIGSIQKIKNQLQLRNSIDFTSQEYTIDLSISFQYLLGIKIWKFICQSVKLMNIFSIQRPRISENTKIIKRNWQQILDDFTSNNAHNFCSGQLAITILTLDGVVKRLENSQGQDEDDSFIKALQIWFRIQRDPRAKYKPFFTNHWVIYITEILISIKSKGGSNFNSQQVFYLRNILECFYSNAEVQSYIMCDNPKWLAENLPINNISGIFYSKFDLFLPAQDQKNLPFLKTGNSLIEAPQDNMSSKSNFSDSMSNTNSTFGKGRRKNRRKIFDIINFNQSRCMRNGVYQWGKGVNSVPLLYTMTKNLDVFNISCGNYHVVVATSIGIFGWGENGSGQLGAPSSKQSVKGIKLILQKMIQPKQNVLLACGNQHTAILIQHQNLVMFGQTQGGIIAGNGKPFDFISCGGLHSLGIKQGRVYSWGRGQGGQLGHKTQILKTKKKQQSTDFYLDQPTLIPNLPHITKSACGDAHSILMSKNGEVFVFGFSYQGQLGLGITGDSETFQVFQPIKLQIKNSEGKPTKISNIFAGPTFTFFTTQDGEILSCGLNDCNQLGKEKMMKVFQKKKYIGKQTNIKNDRVGQIQFSKPKKIQIFNKQIKVDQIYCGENHCLASVQYIKKNKMIMGWGLNKQFQISSEFPPDSIAPRTLNNLFDFNFSQICCGNNFSLGLIKNQNRIGLRQVQQNIQQLLKKVLTFNYKV